MTIQPGQMLLHYRLVEKIGEGGMGVVWKALDTTLDREVAIKILPEGFSRDPGRLARFEREAKLLASLNHSNIAAVYGLHEVDGVRFIAMELVVGEELAERLSRGPLSIDDALATALQIAEALEAAHEQGVIHRDLKPANIKVAPDGKAKVLDFGLAKTFQPDASSSDASPSMSPTVTSAGTVAGVILGTAAYMSPEQAKGKPVDRRTDIWAFGCIVFEMLAGKRVFAGATVAETNAAILKNEPEWDRLPGTTPLTIRRLLRYCLEKEPHNRLQHIGDARIQISAALSEPATPEGVITTGSGRPTRWSRAIPLVLGGAVAGALIVFAGLSYLSPSAPDQDVRKFLIGTQGFFGYPEVSPDGRKIAYVEGESLWVRYLDRFERHEIAPGAGVQEPFWSSESDFVGYFDVGSAKLKKVPVGGGASLTICDLPAGAFWGGACWRSDDTILVTLGSAGLFEVPARGGGLRLLDAPGEDETWFYSPILLRPNGPLLYSVWNKRGGSELVVRTAEGRRTVFQEPRGPMFSVAHSPSGHLLYQLGLVGRGIWAVPFSLSAMKVRGEPFLVLGDGRLPSVASDGTLVYELGAADAGPRRLVWVDRAGKIVGTIGQPQRGIREPSLSPDDTRVAVSAVEDENWDIWVHDSARGTKTRLTSYAGYDFEPSWSPKGDQIAFASLRGMGGEIYLKSADGSGEARSLATGPRSSEGTPDWSGDGTYLAYFVHGSESEFDLAYLDFSGETKPQLVAQTPFFEIEPAISPGGRFVAYTSNESGRYEVYVRSFPSGEGKWLISVNGGMHPKWSGIGGELFYKEGNALMLVKVRTSGDFRAEAPRKLFDGDEQRLYDDRMPIDPIYDVTSDGQRFVMIQSLEERQTGIAVVQNWFAEFENKE